MHQPCIFIAGLDQSGKSKLLSKINTKEENLQNISRKLSTMWDPEEDGSETRRKTRLGGFDEHVVDRCKTSEHVPSTDLTEEITFIELRGPLFDQLTEIQENCLISTEQKGLIFVLDFSDILFLNYSLAFLKKLILSIDSLPILVVANKCDLIR